MAQEHKRGCGYRKVGGLYLCGEYVSGLCDRLPLPLECCPTCGGGIKVSRGFTKIIPTTLFGYHQDCIDKIRPCKVCDPTEDTAFIMLVGDKYYTPKTFIAEATGQGVSKRIPFIPKDLELGKTIIYLAHHKACEVIGPAIVQQARTLADGDDSHQKRLLDADEVKHRTGIFTAFVPQRIEKLIWKSDATKKELTNLKKRGITPIVITDGDKEHNA